MNQNFTKFAFTKSVKEAQEQYGSRKSYARIEESGDRNILTEQEISFIASRDSFYMATVGENGWPYVQFRGGPKGFFKILDDTTLGIADFRGNRQYISVGNINSSRKAALFLIDYPSKRRLKIWTEAEVLETNEYPELSVKLSLPEYEEVVERLIVFKVQAYDWNCPQYITPRFTEEEIKQWINTQDSKMIKSWCSDEKG